MKRHYFVCMRDDSLRLIGPFDSSNHLSQWARLNNPKDDPRWQSIELDDDDAGWDGWRLSSKFAVPHFLPSDGPMPD